MNIAGFQKLTLLDFPGKTAATLFTPGCNFRCPFCHNAGLVLRTDEAEHYSEEEVLSYLNKRKGILDGVCITGGEPLLQRDIAGFMEKLKSLGYKIKLDTNGSFPEKLRELVQKGLVDYVAMDIKNSKEKYAATVGIDGFDTVAIEESVSYLLSGAVDFEFRTTVVDELHTEEDIEALASWIAGAPRYFLQNFVDSGDLIGRGLSAASREKLDSMRKIASRYIDVVEVRGV